MNAYWPNHIVVSGLSKPFNTSTKVFFKRKFSPQKKHWHVNQRQHSYNINTKRQRKQINSFEAEAEWGNYDR